MSTRDHTRWTDMLSELLDGGLNDGARRELEAHLAECGTCRTILADLQEIRDAAGRLDSPLPPRDLWPGIAAVIGRAGARSRTEVIQLPTGPRRGRKGPSAARGLFLTVPQMAAAAVVLTVVSAALTWTAGPGIAARDIGSPAPTRDAPVSMVADVADPPPDLAQELSALESVLGEAKERLDPTTLRILEKNLQVIERAIEDSRHALAVDPGNAFLRRHLEATYREKVDYLRETRDLMEWIS
ncbi:MAG: zf-HC2 domain-containing protein [Gemmatimonadota bacterium]